MGLTPDPTRCPGAGVGDKKEELQGVRNKTEAFFFAPAAPFCLLAAPSSREFCLWVQARGPVWSLHVLRALLNASGTVGTPVLEVFDEQLLGLGRSAK